MKRLIKKGARPLFLVALLIMFLPPLTAFANASSIEAKEANTDFSQMPVVTESSTVAELLNRAAESHRNLSYTGIVTYQADDRLKSYRISHLVKNGETVERIEPLDSDSGSALALDHSLGCVHPGHQLLKYYAGIDQQVASGAQSATAMQLSRLYHAQSIGETRVAGRTGNEYVLQAQDPFRLSYRMVLDAENSLLLRSELLSPNGIVIERFQYMLLEEQPAEASTARTNSVKSQKAVDHVSHSAPIAVAASRQLMLNAKWQPRWLPPGFLLADLDENPADGISFTDGLAMFTLFIEPLDDDRNPQPNMPNVMRRGATLAYTQSIVQHGDMYRITAVGEVPLATLQQVVQSLKQQP